MTIRMISMPVHAITCAADGCNAEIRDNTTRTDWCIRRRAYAAGWQLRPRSGKGSRSAPDYCPEHRTDGAR